MKPDIAENRNHLNYSKWIYGKHILGYRNTILRLFGAQIVKHSPDTEENNRACPLTQSALCNFERWNWHQERWKNI